MVAHKNDINKKKLKNDNFLCSNKYYKPRSKMKTEYSTLGENISEKKNTIPINKGHIYFEGEIALKETTML